MSKRQPRKKGTKVYRRKGKTVVRAAAHGRPGEYNKIYHDHLAYQLGLLGCSEEEIAAHFQIAPATLSLWKKDYPSLSKAIYDSGEKADAEVAQSLRNRAVGYAYSETVVKKDGEKTVTIVNRKEMPADVRAAELWLRNRVRAREKWAKRIEGEEPPPAPPEPTVTPIVNINQIDFSKLTTEQLEQLATILAAGSTPSGK